MRNNSIEDIKAGILRVFSVDFLEKRFRSLDYLPRWIIFGIDVAIVIFANIVTYYLISNLTVFRYNTLDVSTRYGIVVAVNMIFFLVFRTYSGIIRHSTFMDGVKLLFSTISSFFTLLTINYISFLLLEKKYT